MQDRGLDRGCFAVCWGMSWVETAGALQGALRGGGAHWIGLLSCFGVGDSFDSDLSLSLSLSLSPSPSLSPLTPSLHLGREIFHLRSLINLNLESTAIPISIVASGTSTITALALTPNLPPKIPKAEFLPFYPLVIKLACVNLLNN